MLPPLQKTDALFLDFDGTLVEIAGSPSAVIITNELLQLIARLQERLSGAVALISGRPIADLDELLRPLTFAAAGEHGAEIRYLENGQIISESVLPQETRAAVQELARKLHGTELELKRASASLHYRQAPEHESAVIAGMHHLESQLEGYALMLGKMVAELKPETVDKGLAIRDLCTREPFAGRRPVFIGDDVTDESGFVAVNELDGVSIRVGAQGETTAKYSLTNIDAVHVWLGELL